MVPILIKPYYRSALFLVLCLYGGASLCVCVWSASGPKQLKVTFGGVEFYTETWQGELDFGLSRATPRCIAVNISAIPDDPIRQFPPSAGVNGWGFGGVVAYTGLGRIGVIIPLPLFSACSCVPVIFIVYFIAMKRKASVE